MEFTKPNGKRRVVVTGGGMVSALGRDWEIAYANLKTCKNKIRYMPEWERYTKMNTRLACPFDEELPTFPRKKVRGMGRVALLGLLSTHDALAMAGLLAEDGINRTVYKKTTGGVQNPAGLFIVPVFAMSPHTSADLALALPASVHP